LDKEVELGVADEVVGGIEVVAVFCCMGNVIAIS